MSTHPYLQHGVSIFHARLHQSVSATPAATPAPANPFITISREACAGATTVGRHLLPMLDEHLGGEGRSWMFLDKDLLQQALTANQLPPNLAEFLPEDRLPEIKGLIGEMMGLHPPLWELEHRVAEAIHRFAELGRVILAGRAAHLVTQDLPGGLHVRLVAPLEVRIRRAQKLLSLDAAAAESYLHNSDQARQRHVQNNYGRDINDPHTYDLVLNTQQLQPEIAAHLIFQALLSRVTAAAGPVA